jgi:hypothetical protein
MVACLHAYIRTQMPIFLNFDAILIWKLKNKIGLGCIFSQDTPSILICTMKTQLYLVLRVCNSAMQ